MLGLNELKRRLENIVQVGTVSETKTKDGKALARVILDDDGETKRVSAFLPVVSLANSFVKVWFPIRVNEQVLVISPFGNANSGFIIRSIFNRGCKEPDGSNEHTAIIEFEDGTVISYDSKASNLKINAVKSINIFCVDVNIEASNSAYVKAPVTTIESETLVKGSLTVEKLFTALGGMKVNPSAAGDIEAEFNCNIKVKDIEASNINASGEISDEKGSLTNHTNNNYSRD